MATLEGRPVDRPAVSFYETGGRRRDPSDPDPFNIFNDPSWLPLLTLAEEQTDLIRMGSPTLTATEDNCRDEFFHVAETLEDGSRVTRTTLQVAGRALTSVTRRDPDVNTIWTLEHLLKDLDDLKAYLTLPDEVFSYRVDTASLRAEEQRLGDCGIVMVDTADPICSAAELFSMEDYTVLALTEPTWFHRLLAKLAQPLYERTEMVARAFPGHLWRIYGPEYAAEPFLPPRLFREYVVRYTQPMVEAISRHGGFARIHCHGRIRAILPAIVEMGAAALDPIEPAPQGDVELAEVRRQYGRDLVLMGNLKIRDIETMEPRAFAKVVARSLRDGTGGQGRGFVLMPDASPYGRKLSDRTVENYRTIARTAAEFRF